MSLSQGDLAMTNSTKTKKKKSHTTFKQTFPAIQTILNNIQNPELQLVLKLGAGLWLFVGVCAILGWVSMKPEAKLLEVSRPVQSSNDNQISQMNKMHQSLQLLQSRQSRWRPGQHATGECGALQDSNMRRLGSSATIQQFVDDAPPGYETPYRVQQY
jgi:hypothetical protein